jgi:hypothetical protein
MRTLPIAAVILLNASFASQSKVPQNVESEGSCAPWGTVSGKHEWLAGDYTVVPVDATHQKRFMRQVRRGALKEINQSVANAVTGIFALPKTAHYYLLRVRYVGDAPNGTVPDPVNMKADVDAKGIAYVTSFVLSHSSRTTEIAAVLASPTLINRVVATCGAAE